MKIPLTKYGLPQAAVFPAVVMVIMAVCLLLPLPCWFMYLIEAVLAIILIWILSFFRDPCRKISSDTGQLLSPADGTVVDIEIVQENDFIAGPALRIGIFLSVFNVHINRSPCNATVEKITYKTGQFKDARDPLAGKVNESNSIAILRTDEPKDRLIVRQISGAIARRIVCVAKPGQKLTGGEKYGMIKFGSRTELYTPVRKDIKRMVKTGDKVKAGLSVLVRYEK
jgi:phosphatidylserine decarboxylase